MKVSNNANNNAVDVDRLRQMNRRKEQNRNAQRRLRERKEEYTSQLEAQLTELHRHSQSQEDESRFLREALDRMRSENHMLTQQIAMFHQNTSPSTESHPVPQRASIDLGTNHFAQIPQIDTRSRSHSEASKPQSTYASNTLPSSAKNFLPSATRDRARYSSSASPMNTTMPPAAGSQARGSRSPSTLHHDSPELSPFGSDKRFRSGSEQAETATTSSSRSCFADVIESASKCDEGTKSNSSHLMLPKSDGLMTNCLDSIYTQPAPLLTNSATFGQSHRSPFDFTAPWTPSGGGNFSGGDLMLSDLKGLQPNSTSKAFGVIPEAIGFTNSGMRSLGTSAEGWTMSPWLNMGSTPSGDAAKLKADGSFPETVEMPMTADQPTTADRHASLASRRGFSRTLNFEQAPF